MNQPTDELTMSHFAKPLDLYKAKLLQAEKRIEELKQQRDELLKAAINLRDVKGRFHTEQAMNKLFEAIAKVTK